MIEQLKTKNSELRRQELDTQKRVHSLTTEVRELATLKANLEKEQALIKETAQIKERELRAAQDSLQNERRREQICIEKREHLLQRIEEMNIKSQALER